MHLSDPSDPSAAVGPKAVPHLNAPGSTMQAGGGGGGNAGTNEPAKFR